MININILLLFLLCNSGINPFVLLVILPILLVSIQMLQKLYNNYNKLYFLLVTLFLFLIAVVYYIAIGGNMLSVDDCLSNYNISLMKL